MLKILFIVNPTSGTKTSQFSEALIGKYLDQDQFSYQVHITKHAGDGCETVKDRLQEFDGFVAVGGDGTVNEVFNGILGTDRWFSIIPSGSGNGLARSLGIPMSIPQAFSRLNHGEVKSIDYGIINGECFINVAGIGFDAKIARKFKKRKKRGFTTYAKITMKEYFRYKDRAVKMEIDGKKVKEKALLISFANSNQFGNNAVIAPNARVDDGKLRIIVLKKFAWFWAPFLAFRLFNRSIDQSRLYKEYVVENARIKSRKGIHLHVDGESRKKVHKINLEVVPGGVKVRY